METPVDPAGGKDRLARIVGFAETLYKDADFHYLKEWKSKNPGVPVIGYLPVYMPREVVHAAGGLAAGFFGGGDAVEIVKGDAFFQSYICHLPRSTVELALSGALDGFDGMVFPSTCDVIRNLSGMWQILFPNKYVKYLDLPQNFSDALGGEFFRHEIADILQAVAKISGVEPTADRLRHAIALYNENRARVEELYQLRREAPWIVPTSELYLVLRAGNVIPVEDHNKLLGEYIEAAKAANRHPMDMARVVVRGCFCEQPPLDLIRTLERSGCYIVDDDWMLAMRWIQGPVETEGDPLDNLVHAFLTRSISCPSVLVADGSRGQILVKAVRDSKAEGVLFAAPSFCDPALLDQPMGMAAVKEANIPSTSFLFAENTGQFQTIREQAGTFADAIKLS